MRAVNGDNLQAVLAETKDGETLLVEPGTYAGIDLSAVSSLRIVAEGVCNIEGAVEVADSRNVTIRGFNIVGGVKAKNVDGINVSHCSLLAGIKATECKRLLVERNNYADLNEPAVDAVQCGPGVVISTNELMNHQAEIGIRLEGCTGATLEHNKGTFADDVKKGALISISKDCESITLGEGNTAFSIDAKVRGIDDKRSASKRESAPEVPTVPEPMETLEESNTAPVTEPEGEPQ